jgi:hypothetical protein
MCHHAWLKLILLKLTALKTQVDKGSIRKENHMSVFLINIDAKVLKENGINSI